MDIDNLKEFFKLAPGLALLPVSIYLAWKKLFLKASASIQISYGRLTGAQISSVTVFNEKDKPLIITALHLAIDKDYYLKLKKFETPLIIKGLEAVNITPDEISYYYIGSDEIEDPFSGSRKLEVYISTPNKVFRCSQLNSLNIYKPLALRHMKEVSTHIQSFNGVTYTKHAVYAVCYSVKGEEHLALIDDGGLIGRDWTYLPNAINLENMPSTKAIEKLLTELPIAKSFDWLYVHKLKK